MPSLNRYVIAYHDEQFREKFNSRVEVGNVVETDCWRWIGTINNNTGYGQISYGYGGLLAHRFMYMITTGHYPASLEIHHICGNKWCVSPYHLEALTHLQHSWVDKDSAYCPNGHIRSPENALARKDGYYACKICKSTQSREYRSRKSK